MSRPQLPGVDRIGLLRLSVENLLDDSDANDKACRALRRGCTATSIWVARIEIGRRFAATRQGYWRGGKGAPAVESDYADLQRRISELPALQRRLTRRRGRRQARTPGSGAEAAMPLSPEDRESALHGFARDMAACER